MEDIWLPPRGAAMLTKNGIKEKRYSSSHLFGLHWV